ncbi:MAG: hypothetical protein ACFE9A_21135, partial [Candidatus Hodarchaeota archaeon]
MSSKRNLLLLLFGIVFIIGLILVIDEIRIVPFLEEITPFLDDIGFPERILPDLSAFHIEPLHHWQFGVVLMIFMIVCIAGVFLYSH